MSADLFFGYDSEPEVNRHALLTACRELAGAGAAQTLSWEDLEIDGRIIIGRVLDAIDASKACAFDVTTFNENVLFELGYAITKAKPIWLLLDGSDDLAKEKWRRFQLLKPVGYTSWTNIENLKVAYFRLRPDHSERTLYDDLIEPSLEASNPDSIFYVPAFHNTEPARRVGNRLERERYRGIHLVTADPTESGLSPLEWYAAKAYETYCTIVHFESPRRSLASLHNPRSALIAGMARGLDRPVLMLAEEDYSGPLDYENTLSVYTQADACERLLDEWLAGLELRPRSGTRAQRVKLSTELRTLRFGEPVAENEQDTLADYFIDTSALDDVLATRNALFVGRKGSGKTANMFQAAARLSEDARNLVVVVKPASYEFTSIVSLLPTLSPSLQQYFIEALWQFLLTSEIANRTLEAIEGRPSIVPLSEDERQLFRFIEGLPFKIRTDFGLRLESTISTLTGAGFWSSDNQDGRNLLNEHLHSDLIARLRSLLGRVLTGTQRVAILIDNLDKGWDRHADLDVLAHLLLGLLAAIGRVTKDFQREDSWRRRVALTMAIFLRADIFQYLQTVAREPDKLPVSRLQWDDPHLLLRVIEERFLAARPPDTEPNELWDRFCCPTVQGIETRSYLTQRCLPRPRDLIYFCNAMTSIAANRRSERIDESDVLAGELLYSQFAFEALLVENGVTISEIESVLYEFAGEAAFQTESSVLATIERAGPRSASATEVLERLKALSFLGVETAPGRFEFADGGQSSNRREALARRTAREGAADPRLSIHPAYRAYLEIQEDRPSAVGSVLH